MTGESNSYVFDNKLAWEEIEVPAQRETFEAQVLVVTKAYKKQTIRSPIAIDGSLYVPLSHALRVIQGGKYHLELVPSATAYGKPTLILYEE